MAENDSYKSGIDWIDNHASLHAICSVFDSKDEDLEDNLIFEEIEGEIMKRGTLAHNAIRWDFVVEQTTFLLGQEAKDFRLLGFLILSLPQLPSSSALPAALPLAAQLAWAFIGQWSDQATPRGRARERALNRIIDALEAQVKRAEDSGLEAHYRAPVIHAFEQMAKILGVNSADIAAKFTHFAKRIDNIIEEGMGEPPPQSPPVSTPQIPPQTSATTNTTKTSSAPVNAPRPSDLLLDSSNERALRESLAKMADFLFDLDPAQPLSYRLRRYAGWYGMREQPALKKDNATIILPPSEESVDLYRQAVTQKQADIDIAKRLERSCYLQPFWLEGHHLAWKLARIRGATEAAHAILQEANQFTKNAPWLEKLQFASGAPFLPDEVKDWLTSQPHTVGVTTTGSGDTREKTNPFEEVRTLAQGGDVAAAIERMEGMRPLSGNLREQSLWEIASLEILSEWGMKTHVGLTAARLEESISMLTVAEWDIGTLERLRRLKL